MGIGNQQSGGGNFWGNLGNTFLGMLPGIGGIIGGHQNERRDYRNRRNLTRQEYEYQRRLARYGADLQYEMWQKTNYPAQIEMLKAAGLNPGLMYGMSGGGGTTTGSQTGGNVSAAGSGGQMQPMDVTNMMKVLAEIKNIDSSTDVNKATEKDILETLPGDVKKLDVEADNIVASTKELGSRNILNLANSDLRKAQISLTKQQEKHVIQQVKKTIQDTEAVRKMLEMDYSDKTGKNVWVNLEKFVNGEYNLGTYIGAASTIATLGVLRGAAARPGAYVKVGKQAINKIKGLYNKAKTWWKYRQWK